MILNPDFKEFVKLLTKNNAEYLIVGGYAVNFGARPLKRTIQKYLINPLSQELLAGNFVGGDTINVTVGEKAGLVFSKARST